MRCRRGRTLVVSRGRVPRVSVRSDPLANVGSVRLSGEEARRRLQQGGSSATFSTKLLTRPSAAVYDLAPHGSGIVAAPPEWLQFQLGPVGDDEFEDAMSAHADKNLSSVAEQVSELRKKMYYMGHFNYWLGRAGYFDGEEKKAVAEWVERPADQVVGRLRYDLVPIMGADGEPCTYSPAAVIEYLMAMAHGNAESMPKGGEPAFRNKRRLPSF